MSMVKDNYFFADVFEEYSSEYADELKELDYDDQFNGFSID